MPGRSIAVFAKPPVPGRVKTRLLGDLSAATAAEVAAASLADLLERLVADLVPCGIEVRIAWALDPGEVPPPSPVGWFDQEPGNLGERMLAAAERIAGEGALPVIVGGDVPDLALDQVEKAFAELERGADLVLGPASDGGFYLIGFGEAARRPELFAAVEWGGGTVLARTLANARVLGLEVELLDEASDVDRPEDLPRLAARLALQARGGAADPCPRTRALLERLGLAGFQPQETKR